MHNAHPLQPVPEQIRPHGVLVDQIAAALTRTGVPFAFVSGYGSEALPVSFRGALLLPKPFTPQRLIDTVKALLPGERGAADNLVGFVGPRR